MTERQELGSLEAMLFAHAEPVETARLADALRLDATRSPLLCKAAKSATMSRRAAWSSCTSSLTAGR